MLESRANRELCRNGEPLVREVRYSCQKSLEQEHIEASLSSMALLFLSRGYFYGSLGRSANY